MTGSYDSYETAMRDAWEGWWVTWPLSRRVRVGDAFDTSGGTLRTAGDLAGRGVTFDLTAAAPAATFTYDSNGSASVRFKLAGDLPIPPGFSALTKADAGALVEFGRSSSVLVVYSGLTQQGMSDTRSVAEDLVRQYWKGSWPEELVGVTDVVSAAGGTVLAAAGSGASAELRASAGVGAGPITLLDLAGSVTVARAAQVGLQWVGSDVTPFYRVVRLKRTWLNNVKTQYGPRQPGLGAAPGAVPPILVEEARDEPEQVLERVPAGEQPAPPTEPAERRARTGPGGRRMTGPAAPARAVDAALTVTADGAGGFAVTLAVHADDGAGPAERVATGQLGPELAAVADDGAGGAAAPYTAVLDRRAARTDREAVGDRLFAGLVRGDVAGLWADLEAAAEAGDQVRVRLDVRPPMLKALPWELLRNGSWVCLRRNVSLWRGSAPVAVEPADAGPLRVLVVVCNPQDQQILSDDELSRVAGALADKLGRMHLEILDGPGRTTLREEIDRLRPHVLHFIGHGMPRVPGRPAALAFNWTPRQQATAAALPVQWDLGSDDVGLLSEWAPRLVVVNACRTADEPLDQVGGFAEAFLAAGAGAVVSMQADVESPAAAQFATALYEGLGDLLPLDRVVADARRRIRMDTGDTGDWAMPVLAGRADPADVLRITFDRPAESIARLCQQPEYARLRHFLDRSTERRMAWWAFDPPPAEVPGRSLLVIGGRSGTEAEPTGKTWLTRWCLFTYFLRGHRVTYVDLAEPLRYRVPGRDEMREVTTKDWLDVIRVVRQACLDSQQPEPLPASAFAAFNASLNTLVSGPVTTAATDGQVPPEVADEMQPFDDNRTRAAEYREQIMAEFRAALASASERPHVIALDHADKILPESFEAHVYPGLIRPVAETAESSVRLVLVAPGDWLNARLPAADKQLWKPVSLGDFESAQFMRLARDYCRRHGHDFTWLEGLFTGLHAVNPGPVPVTTFDKLIKLAGPEPARGLA